MSGDPVGSGGTAVGAAGSAERRPRILLVTHSSPVPETRGGNQRTSLLIRALQQVSRVDFLLVHRDLADLDPDVERTLRDEFGLVRVLRPWGGPGGSPLRRFVWKLRAAARTQYVRLGLLGRAQARDRAIRDAVRARLSEEHYDAVVVRYLEVAGVADPFGTVPVIVDADDLESARYRSVARAPGVGVVERLAARLALGPIRRRTARLLARCDHVWVTSEAERAALEHPSTSVLPNIPFDPPAVLPEPAANAPDLLLVASLRYAVNRQAVDHFVRAIWPRIRAARPDASVRIAGAGMPGDLEARWAATEGVIPLGFVADLAREYARCLVTVAPVFHGGGTKIKILEALAHRRACVTTRHGHAGLAGELPAGEAIVVAEDAADFASRCVDLLDRPEEARRIADRGCRIVREAFALDRFAGEVARTVREVADG